MAFRDVVSERTMRVAAVVAVVAALVTVVTGVAVGGVAGALEGLVFLYIAVVFAYGVFRDELATPRVQAALGAGVAAYGGLLYATGGSLLWLGLAFLAFVIVAQNLYELAGE